MNISRLSRETKQWTRMNIKGTTPPIGRQDHEFPADTVPLHCSGEGGNCCLVSWTNHESLGVVAMRFLINDAFLKIDWELPTCSIVVWRLNLIYMFTNLNNKHFLHIIMNSDFCLAKSTAWRLSASTNASLTGQIWLNFNSMCQKHHLGRLKSYENFFCCHPNSWGYVSTANLDGETNLKLKTAPQLTQGALTTGALMLGGDGVYDSQHFLGKVSHSVLVMNYPPLDKHGRKIRHVGGNYWETWWFPRATVDGRHPAPTWDVQNLVNAGINYLWTGERRIFCTIKSISYTKKEGRSPAKVDIANLPNKNTPNHHLTRAVLKHYI